MMGSIFTIKVYIRRRWAMSDRCFGVIVLSIRESDTISEIPEVY